MTQFSEEQNLQAQSYALAHKAWAALWQGQAAEGLHAAQEALRLAEETARTRYPHEWDFVRVYWLLGWAQAKMGQLTAAQSHLDEAQRRCRAINLVEFEPSILLALARLAFAQSKVGMPDGALASGQREQARQHAQRAYELAYCDGPPDVYKPALDEAARLLAVVG